MILYAGYYTGYYTSLDKYSIVISRKSVFEPPGTHLHSYTSSDGKHYHIYKVIHICVCIIYYVYTYYIIGNIECEWIQELFVSTTTSLIVVYRDSFLHRLVNIICYIVHSFVTNVNR